MLLKMCMGNLATYLGFLIFMKIYEFIHYREHRPLLCVSKQLHCFLRDVCVAHVLVVLFICICGDTRGTVSLVY